MSELEIVVDNVMQWISIVIIGPSLMIMALGSLSYIAYFCGKEYIEKKQMEKRHKKFERDWENGIVQ